MRNLFFIVFVLFLKCSNSESIPTKEDWILFEKENKESILEFKNYLNQNKVTSFPIEEILRQGTSWKKFRQEPFLIPPKSDWKNILATVRVLEEEIIPLVGPLEILSGYRTKTYNYLAGGAAKSKHLKFYAFDLRPKRQISRKELHEKLLEFWTKKGRERNLGLGLYSGTRFHIDTAGYRKW